MRSRITLCALAALSLGGEVRWQKASADLSDEFLGPKLDLGGFHYLATIHVKF